MPMCNVQMGQTPSKCADVINAGVDVMLSRCHTLAHCYISTLSHQHIVTSAHCHIAILAH